MKRSTWPTCRHARPRRGRRRSGASASSAGRRHRLLDQHVARRRPARASATARCSTVGTATTTAVAGGEQRGGRRGHPRAVALGDGRGARPASWSYTPASSSGRPAARRARRACVHGAPQGADADQPDRGGGSPGAHRVRPRAEVSREAHEVLDLGRRRQLGADLARPPRPRAGPCGTAGGRPLERVEASRREAAPLEADRLSPIGCSGLPPAAQVNGATSCETRQPPPTMAWRADAHELVHRRERRR